MKYAQRDELVLGLRELADFIEANGHKLSIRYPAVRLAEFVYADYDDNGGVIPDSARIKMGNTARILSPCEKNWSEGYLDIQRKFGKYVSLKFMANRELVCEKKVVGSKFIPEHVIPARNEDIVEWECTDSLLK